MIFLLCNINLKCVFAVQLQGIHLEEYIFWFDFTNLNYRNIECMNECN